MSGSEPRSGVRGLSPFQFRFRLLENGWAALPIVRHDAREKDAGKKPSIAGWNDFAEYAAALPTADDHAGWESGNHRAPGTGIAIGNEVAIDLDFIRDPILASRAYDITVATCGETPFVLQGQAPKTALVYRSAEPIETLRLKATNGSGDGVDIIGHGAQLVVFGIHPILWSPTSGWALPLR